MEKEKCQEPPPPPPPPLPRTGTAKSRPTPPPRPQARPPAVREARQSLSDTPQPVGSRADQLGSPLPAIALTCTRSHPPRSGASRKATTPTTSLLSGLVEALKAPPPPGRPPCSPRRSCPRRQPHAGCAGHCRCTGWRGSCGWAWATAPGALGAAAQCCCSCRLAAGRWLSIRHHTGQSDLYC